MKLIEGDRHHLGEVLKDIHFDVVADITAYTANDISDLYAALGSFEQYIMISSSAVYPNMEFSLFLRTAKRLKINSGVHMERTNMRQKMPLLEKVPDAYILRTTIFIWTNE